MLIFVPWLTVPLSAQLPPHEACREVGPGDCGASLWSLPKYL